MYKVTGTTIEMVRGDSVIIKVSMKMSGEDYVPIEGDSLRFAMKHRTLNSTRTEYTDSEPLLIKPISIEDCMLRLNPEDTKDIGFGTYVYDIEITFADGFVDTFIKNAKIKLLPEVH